MKLPLPRLHGFALWASVAGLLSLGMLTTVIDLAKLPSEEAARATQKQQRFTINAGSGEVSLATDKPAEAEDADAAEEEAGAPEAPAGTTAEQAPAEMPGGEAPAPTAEDHATPVPAEATPAEPAQDAAPAAVAPPVEATPAEAVKPAEAAAPAEPAEATTPAEPAAAPVNEPLPANAPTLRTKPLTEKPQEQPHTKDSLVQAPAPEITETVDGLKIPKRGDKNVVASKLYAHPFKRMEDQVLISFVVINAGLDPQSIGLAMALPPEVTIAYSPYTRSDSSYSENMRAIGHEVWTMMPAMGERYPNDDPGPLGIIGRMPPEETKRRLLNVLAAIPGSVGVILPPDETITLQKDTLAPALGEISSRGLFLLSTHPTHTLDTTNKGMAEIIRRADLILDPTPNEAQIKSRLAGLLDSAKEKGEYIVVLTARPQSLQMLSEWLASTKLEAPFVLAPLSAVYQPKLAAEAPEAAEGGGHAEKKPKPPPKKKPKVLPQDQYKQPVKPAGGGGH